MTKRNNHRNGFTLIEILIATSIFIVVAVISVSSLLAASKSVRKLQVSRDVTQAARIVFEQMSRDIRQAKAVACSQDNVVSNCQVSVGPLLVGNAIRICAQDGTTNREYRLDSDSSKIMTRQKPENETNLDWSAWSDLSPTGIVVFGDFTGDAKLFQLRPSHATVTDDGGNVCTGGPIVSINLYPFVQFRAVFLNYDPMGSPPPVERQARYVIYTTVSLRNFDKQY